MSILCFFSYNVAPSKAPVASAQRCHPHVASGSTAPTSGRPSEPQPDPCRRTSLNLRSPWETYGKITWISNLRWGKKYWILHDEFHLDFVEINIYLENVGWHLLDWPSIFIFFSPFWIGRDKELPLWEDIRQQKATMKMPALYPTRQSSISIPRGPKTYAFCSWDLGVLVGLLSGFDSKLQWPVCPPAFVSGPFRRALWRPWSEHLRRWCWDTPPTAGTSRPPVFFLIGGVPSFCQSQKSMGL